MKIRNLVIDVTIHDVSKRVPRECASVLVKRLAEELDGVGDWDGGIESYSRGIAWRGEIEFAGRISDSDMAAKIGEIVKTVIPDEDAACIILVTEPEE